MLAVKFSPEYDCRDLVTIFNNTFTASYHTVLQGGGHEPLYTPSVDEHPAKIVFAHDYFSSALHEISHWLIAGATRRQYEDYGYWYCPDGRNQQQQAEFERVEVSPQALEWILSKACGRRFRLSLDNLTGESGDSESFARAVLQRVQRYAQEGLPNRAELMRHALCQYYSTPLELDPEDFTLKEVYNL